MNANLMSRKIEMSKSEAKAAGKINSEKFVELQQYRAAYPGFEIEIKSPTKRKNEFKGLDYDYMVKYIKNCKREDKDNILEEFNTLTAQAKKHKEEGSENLETASYIEVKKWFLAKFPEIKEFRENSKKRIQEILDQAA